MRQLLTIMAAASFAVLVVSCGGSSSKDAKGQLTDKKVEVEKLKKEQDALTQKISALEKEIIALDPDAAAKPKLVAVTTIGSDTFSHFVDLQGKIDAKNVVNVSPRGGPGVARAVYVTQGQQVRKGQVLVKLDDALQRQNVVAAQQQLGQIKARLDQAQTIYERHQKLWQQNIGAEINVINAKADVDALQAQLRAAQAQVGVAQEQVNFTNIYAEIGGAIDRVDVRVGETFTGNNQIVIVNTGNLKVLAQVPENYIGRIKQGAVLDVSLPEAGNKTFSTKVTVVGTLIDPNTRSFYVEGTIPASAAKDLRPNQVAMVRIRDYSAPNAITIPVNTLQTDEKGKFVMVAVKEKDKLIARKKQVFVGELYGDKLEVKNGLAAGDVLVTEGFQNLYDGQLITTEVK